MMSLPSPKLKNRGACPLCHAHTWSTFCVLSPFSVVRCSECNLLFGEATLSDDDLTSFYETGYYGLRLKQGQKINAKISCDILKDAIDLTCVKSVLDIGSGYGFLLGILQNEIGASVQGVELANAEAQHARAELGIETHNRLPNQEAKFDLVTMFEVIEHITHPTDFISAAAGLVRPGGYLVVGTDNFESDVVKKLGSKFPKWIPHQHVNFFGEQTFRKLLSLNDFQVVAERSYTPWELGARAIVYSASGGKKGAKEFDREAERATENSRPYKFYALRNWLSPAWAKFTLKKDLKGEMMIIVAQRHSSRA